MNRIIPPHIRDIEELERIKNEIVAYRRLHPNSKLPKRLKEKLDEAARQHVESWKL